MRRLLPALILSFLLGLLAGCAPMSKEECLNANWRALGHGDGANGVHYTYLEKRRQACSDYAVIPDEDAYMAGWNEGIRGFCTSERGYRFGVAGKAYNHICPQDVEGDFLAGWRQGIQQYCAPENGMSLGLRGRSYSGACPPDLEPAFRHAYNRGANVHRARIAYRNANQRLLREQREMRGEKDPAKLRKDAHEVAQLQRQVEQLYFEMSSLEACITDDWFDIGRRDGASGYGNRAGELARGCGFGRVDRRGYNAGWRQGADQYCTYDSGLMIGQNNMPYHGICSGHAHQQFWRGYEEGRERYRDQEEVGHRDVHRQPVPMRVAPAVRQESEWQKPVPVSRPAPRARQAEAEHAQPVKQPEQRQEHKSQGGSEAKEKSSQPGESKARSMKEQKPADENRKGVSDKADKSQGDHGRSGSKGGSRAEEE